MEDIEPKSPILLAIEVDDEELLRSLLDALRGRPEFRLDLSGEETPAVIVTDRAEFDPGWNGSALLVVGAGATRIGGSQAAIVLPTDDAQLILSAAHIIASGFAPRLTDASSSPKEAMSRRGRQSGSPDPCKFEREGTRGLGAACRRSLEQGNSAAACNLGSYRQVPCRSCASGLGRQELVRRRRNRIPRRLHLALIPLMCRSYRISLTTACDLPTDTPGWQPCLALRCQRPPDSIAPAGDLFLARARIHLRLEPPVALQDFGEPLLVRPDAGPRPASQAAPSAVVSRIAGRSTGASRMSARRCIVQSHGDHAAVDAQHRLPLVALPVLAHRVEQVARLVARPLRAPRGQAPPGRCRGSGRRSRRAPRRPNSGAPRPVKAGTR